MVRFFFGAKGLGVFVIVFPAAGSRSDESGTPTIPASGLKNNRLSLNQNF